MRIMNLGSSLAVRLQTRGLEFPIRVLLYSHDSVGLGHLLPFNPETQNECKPITKSEAADELIAPLTWAQRLKRVFDGAAFGLIFPCAHCVAAPCVSSPTSLTQT